MCKRGLPVRKAEFRIHGFVWNKGPPCILERPGGLVNARRFVLDRDDTGAISAISSREAEYLSLRLAREVSKGAHQFGSNQPLESAEISNHSREDGWIPDWEKNQWWLFAWSQLLLFRQSMFASLEKEGSCPSADHYRYMQNFVRAPPTSPRFRGQWIPRHAAVAVLPTVVHIPRFLLDV
ncbi:hypothetical protein CLAIMM_07772 isoform 3 [Cladophialophora immunda]|nr:hypothetical protein CLAIMM_07772 isoform 2 [Cladophialophora immunda]OQV02609.1 hypothetical protein CLAIMM_07772 isoform 3 [Cladophialophora immunda]